MKRWIKTAATFAAFAMILAACGTPAEEAADTTVATDAPTTQAPVTQAPVAGLPDLGGIDVTVGVENAYLPFNYIPIGETEGTGWDYDVWVAICELLNCNPVMTVAGWPAVLEQVANGELDTAADGISITAERAETMAFSDAYMVVQQRFVVLLDDDRYADADAVIADADAIIGTQIGTTNYQLAETLVGAARIQAYDQFALAIQALVSGDVDAVIIDDAAGLGYIGENADLLTTVDGGMQSDPLGFIFPLGSTLIDPVNQALAALKDNGTLEELGRKYFTDSFTITYDDIDDPAIVEMVNALPDLGGVDVTVGVENAYLPFNYIPLGETEGTGWDYDAWTAICELLNCNPVMTVAGWPAVLEQVSNGELDTAADGISITAERAETMAFSDAYMVVQQRFVVLLDDDRYADADAVIADADAIIGTQIGTTNYQLAETLVGAARIQAFDQFALAIQALVSGDVDAVIIDDAAGLGYIGENSDLLTTVDGGMQSDPLGFIFPLGSDLIDPVNQALAILKANGGLEELGRKYFTDSFTITYDDIEG